MLDDLSEHPFAQTQTSESYVSPSEKAWLRWVKKAEQLLGWSLDGHQDSDGYSLDMAYAAWEAGVAPEAYAAEARINAVASYFAFGPKIEA